MARPKKEWQEIRNRNVRFYVEKELDSRAWEILHSEEIKVYGSQIDFIILAINDFYERHLKKKQDSYLETREKEDAFVDRIVKAAEEKFDGLSVRVVCVENEFFGPEITVAGLLTGEDYLRALKGTPLGDALLISRTSLRAEGDLFLCGASLDALSEALGVPVIPVENDGFAFLAALLGNA